MTKSTANPGTKPLACIVGLGAATPLGETALTSAAAVRCGLAMFADHGRLVDEQDEPFVVSPAEYLGDLPFSERIWEFTRLAVEDALCPLEVLQLKSAVPVFIGLPGPRPGCPADLGQQLASRLTSAPAGGVSLACAQTFPYGHAAGMLAIEAACRALEAGGARFCLAGGVDSYLAEATLTWLDASRQLHKPSNAWGFVPGEAASYCLLCTPQTAEQAGLPVLGTIAAMATTQEENRIKTETVCVGRGLTEAVRRVMSAPQSGGLLVDNTICDLNGEAYRADEYGFTLARTSHWFRDASEFLAPADCWGDVGAASGPLFMMLSTMAASRGYSKGPCTLVWTSSESGERSAALICTG